MNTKRGSILSILIIALAVASATSAYVLKTWRWPSPRATFNDSSLPSAWRTVVRNAAEEWEDTGDFDWDRSSSSQNKLTLERIDGSGGTLATTTNSRFGDFLYRIGILFDSSESWHTSSGTPPSSKLDALSVATHEFGHAVGIDHPESFRCGSGVSASSRPTMCQHGDLKKNDTSRRSLASDDRNAIEDQYNGTSSAPSAGLQVGPQQTVCVDFDTAFISADDVVRSAEQVVHGIVTEVGPTRWNSNDGVYWGDVPSSSAVLPYHTVTIAPSDVLYDEHETLSASTSVSIIVSRMSPVDASGCGATSVGPFAVGDEVIVFLEKRSMAWRSGGMRRFVQPVNDPYSAGFVAVGDGSFRAFNASVTTDGQTTNEIRSSIHDLKNISD